MYDRISYMERFEKKKSSYKMKGKELVIMNINFCSEEIMNNLKKVNKLVICNDPDFPLHLIPSNVTCVVFNRNYYDIPGRIPSFVRYIVIEPTMDNCIFRSLPDGLKRLELRKLFNGRVSSMDDDKGGNIIPDGVEDLILSGLFNDSVDYLPKNVKRLELGDKFNRAIDNLPERLEKLVLGEDFNKECNNLPANLRKLFFGFAFNKSIDFLPPNLEELYLGYCFNQFLGNLPRSLKILILGKNYNQDLECLPDGLEVLGVNYEYVSGRFLQSGNDFDRRITTLPKSLKYLMISNKYKYMKELEEILDNVNLITKLEVELGKYK